MSDEPNSDAAAPMSMKAKIVTGVVGAVLVTGAGFLMLRVSSPAIRPDQVPPAGHYAASCGACHSISSDARAIKVVR